MLKNFQNYEALKKPLANFIKYKSISEFPSSYRDLSFSVKDPSEIIKVIELLSNVSSKNLKTSFMFDFYENKKIDECKIGFRFIFQSHIGTLKDFEINNEIKKIIDPVLAIKSVSLPGI